MWQKPWSVPNVAFFAADYICKPPRRGKGVHWHQDGHYWPLEPMEVITVWFAITASLPSNGCVRVIPGSHRSGLHQPRPGKHRATTSSTRPIRMRSMKARRSRPGTCSPETSRSITRCCCMVPNPNESNAWRRGGSIQYMPATTKVTREWPCLFLFRGSPVEGINTYRKFPVVRGREAHGVSPVARTGRKPV